MRPHPGCGPSTSATWRESRAEPGSWSATVTGSISDSSASAPAKMRSSTSSKGSPAACGRVPVGGLTSEPGGLPLACEQGDAQAKLSEVPALARIEEEADLRADRPPFEIAEADAEVHGDELVAAVFGEGNEPLHRGVQLQSGHDRMREEQRRVHGPGLGDLHVLAEREPHRYGQREPVLDQADLGTEPYPVDAAHLVDAFHAHIAGA